MHVNKLQLQYFRAYSYAEISLSPQMNIVLGGNAQGKSTIIEALSLFALGRSLRAKMDRDMIQFNAMQSSLHVSISKLNGQTDLAIKISERGKQVAVNRIPQKNMSDFLGNLYVVSFTPDDLQLIKGGPEERRRFLNISMSQFIQHYMASLHRYTQLLLQRNRLLKSKQFEALDIWNTQFCTAAVELIMLRSQFVQQLSTFAQEQYATIVHSSETLGITYKTDVKDGTKEQMEMEMEETLKRHLSTDMLRGYTSVGPHRDDLMFSLNEHPLARFGSQAQQRSTVLALKLGLIHYIQKVTNEYPILLLDDVLSELDLERQDHLLSLINKTQTVLTATHTSTIPSLALTPFKSFQVCHGIITEKENE